MNRTPILFRAGSTISQRHFDTIPKKNFHHVRLRQQTSNS